MGRASLFFLWSMRPEANLCASLLDDLVPLHSTTSTRFYSVWAVHSSLQCASLYLPPYRVFYQMLPFETTATHLQCVYLSLHQIISHIPFLKK